MKNKTKVGILTLPLKGNYGGVLQAYALLSFLKKEGYDAFLVDRQWDVKKKNPLSYYLLKYFYHYIIRGRVKLFCDKWVNPKTFKIDSQEKMKLINNEGFDAFIVGSDQVWRVEHTGGVKNNFFLDFIEKDNVKRVSYAASFGKDSVDVDENQKRKISKLLKKFDAISVREGSGVEICKNTFNVDANRVLDPTLLLDESVYLELIKSKKKKKPQTLITYVLDNTNEKNKIIDDIADKLNLTVESINYKKDPALLKKNKSLDFYNHMYPSLYNWLSGFRDAEYIITDSFHGTLFSIIFKKQFIIIGNEKRGLTRFKSFLSLINLEERLITVKSMNINDILSKSIDYSKVYGILGEEKNKSISFLINSLDN